MSEYKKPEDFNSVSEKLEHDSKYLREQIKQMDDFIERHCDDEKFIDSINHVKLLRDDTRYLLALVENHSEFNKKDEHE